MPATVEPQTVLVIVDPFSSGRFLVDYALEKGSKLVCVKSSLQLAPYFLNSLKPEKYVEVIDHVDMETTIATLAKYTVKAVIAGSEPGVELADQLATELEMPTANAIEYSCARRDKFKMNERVREHGLRAVRQCECYTADDALTWVRSYNKYPVVVKPTCSLGTDGVFFCNNEAEVQAACDKTLGKVNPAGQVNERVVIQEYLCGQEWVVDTISYNGRHHLTDMWKYVKETHNGSKFVYMSTTPQPYDCPEREKLQNYVFGCITALGIRYGPTHCEVMWLPDEGPVLVEVNSRMHGALGPHIASLTKDHSQIDLTYDVYTSGDIFQEVCGKPWNLNRKAMWLNFVSPKDGVLKSSLEIDQIRSLPSYHTMMASVQPGQRLQKTVDLMSCPGFIILIHDDAEVIAKDIKTFRELERTHLYNIEDDESVLSA